MDKQELIKQVKVLKNIFGNKTKYVEKNTVIELISKLDEPQKPVVPQFVADWYEEKKDDFENALFRSIDLMPSTYEEGELSEFEEWLVDEHTKPFQILVNMHQFGYKVEKEKRYIVKMKDIYKHSSVLKLDDITGRWFFGSEKYMCGSSGKHTRKELEQAGFGWLFDCPGVEIEEVEK